MIATAAIRFVEVMSSGLLSLRWNNHGATILQLLNNLQNKSRYEDATVACGGKLYPVHRLVLSCCSSYFEQIFALTHGKHSIIVLKDISCEVFEALLSYMYIGRVEVSKEKLGELINAAACLEIKGLAVSEEYQGFNHSNRIKTSLTGQKRHLDLANVIKSNGENPSKFRKTCHSSNSIEIHQSLKSKVNELNTLNLTLQEVNHDKSLNNSTEQTCLGTQLEESATPEIGCISVRSTSNINEEEDEGTVSNQAESLQDSESYSEEAPPPESDTAVFDFEASEAEAVEECRKDNLASEEQLLAAAFCGQQDESPEYSMFSPDISTLPDEDSKASAKEAMKAFDSNHALAKISTSMSTRDARSVPVVLENGGLTSPKQFWVNDDLDLNPPNFDIYSMLDLRYDDASGETGGDNGPEALDPELAALLASSSGNNSKSPILKQHWQCPQCDYSTPVKQYITQHIRRHTGEKPFKCGLCEYRAAQKQSVTYHMRRHTGEKPFKCPHCSYCSSSRQNLDRHVRRHTGEMPYGCPYCSYRSITKGPVVDHMRAKHGERECDKSLVLKLEMKNIGQAPSCILPAALELTEKV